MVQPELSLVVLRTADILKTLLFYRAFGLNFEQECHALVGKGEASAKAQILAYMLANP